MVRPRHYTAAVVHRVERQRVACDVCPSNHSVDCVENHSGRIARRLVSNAVSSGCDHVAVNQRSRTKPGVGLGRKRNGGAPRWLREIPRCPAVRPCVVESPSTVAVQREQASPDLQHSAGESPSPSSGLLVCATACVGLDGGRSAHQHDGRATDAPPKR